MASDVLTQALAGGQLATFGSGRVFNLLSAIAPVSVVLEYKGVKANQPGKRKVFNNLPAGSKFVSDPADGEWTYLRLTNGATAQNITLFVGDDDMSFNQAVTVTGTALVAINPSSALATVNPSNIANTVAVTIPANVNRRRITVAAPASNTGVFYIQTVGTATAKAGIPVAPGAFVEMDTTASFDLRNDSGAVQQYTTVEET